MSPQSSPPVPLSCELTAEERAVLVDYLAGKPKHCRHYSYRRDDEGLGIVECGPHCAVGVPLGAPGASKCCWPTPEPPLCPKRENPSRDENVAAAEELIASRLRFNKVMALIPPPDSASKSGQFGCPCCPGEVRWARSPSNNHLHAGCTTKGCFGVIE